MNTLPTGPKLELTVRAGFATSPNTPPGSLSNPFGSIMDAIRYAEPRLAINGDLFIECEPGVYRELVSSQVFADKKIKVHLDGLTPSPPTLSGAARITGWHKENSLWTTDWHGPVPEPPPFDTRDPFISQWLYDGNPIYTRRAAWLIRWDALYANLERLPMKDAGWPLLDTGWFIDPVQQTLTAKLRYDQDPNNADIELIAREHRIRARNWGGLVLQDFRLAHAGYGLHAANIPGLVADSVSAADCGQEGIHLTRCDHFSLMNVTASGHGVQGIQPTECVGFLYDGVTFYGNNWRGHAYSAYDFVPGNKIQSCAKGRLLNVITLDNLGHNLWIDGGSRDIEIVNLLSSGALTAGLVCEISRHITLRGGLFAGNGRYLSSSAPASAIVLDAVDGFTLDGTRFDGNMPHVIHVRGGDDRTAPDWENPGGNRIAIRHERHSFKPGQVIHAPGIAQAFHIEPWLKERYLESVATFTPARLKDLLFPEPA